MHDDEKGAARIHDFNFDIDAAAELLSVVSNGQRLNVLKMIKEQEVAVGELAARLGLSQSALSQHLKILRDANLVRTRRNAQTVFYSSTSRPVQQLLEMLETMFSTPEN